MNTELKGKTVVVTGAAHGIGREICAGFASAGGRVIGVDKADLKETEQYIKSLDAEFEFEWNSYSIDLASPESVSTGCREILDKYPVIDVLVNNAAFYGGLKITPLEAIDLNEWDHVFKVNVRGSYLMIRELLAGLKSSKGKVINLASGAALRGSPFLLHYVASKGAIIRTFLLTIMSGSNASFQEDLFN